MLCDHNCHMIQRYFVPDGVQSLDQTTNRLKACIHGLEINCSCRIASFEHPSFQSTKKRKHHGLKFGPFKLPKDIVLACISHPRPPLEYCLVAFFSVKKLCQLLFDTDPRSFTAKLVGCSLLFSLDERCLLLQLDSLWLQILHKSLHFNGVLRGPAVAYHLCKTWSPCIYFAVETFKEWFSTSDGRFNVIFFVKWWKFGENLPVAIGHRSSQALWNWN